MDPSIKEAMHLTQKAQEAVQQAQENPVFFQEAQKHLLVAEDSLHNVLTQTKIPSSEEQEEIDRIKDLLRLVEETQQVNRTT